MLRRSPSDVSILVLVAAAMLMIAVDVALLLRRYRAADCLSTEQCPGPSEAPPPSAPAADGYRVRTAPLEPAPLRRPPWRSVLDLLIASAHASPPPADPLAEGKRALSQGWHTQAFRLCMRAAEDKRQPGRRAAALVCQGRAAIGLKWPAAAISLAHQALRLLDESGARLLLADGYRAAGDCKAARPHYLSILEHEPSHPEARAGFAACGGDLPAAPRPDGGAHLHALAGPIDPVTLAVAP